jgi:hypothetical protein
MSVFHLRYIVIQCVLGAALIALWLSGYVKITFGIEGYVVAGIVSLYGLLGLFMVAIRRLADAKWMANMIVRIGIAGMQLCVIVGLLAMAKSMLSGGELAQAGAILIGTMAVALCVSLLALFSHIWIEHSLRLLGWRDEEQ